MKSNWDIFQFLLIVVGVLTMPIWAQFLWYGNEFIWECKWEYRDWRRRRSERHGTSIK